MSDSRYSLSLVKSSRQTHRFRQSEFEFDPRLISVISDSSLGKIIYSGRVVSSPITSDIYVRSFYSAASNFLDKYLNNGGRATQKRLNRIMEKDIHLYDRDIGVSELKGFEFMARISSDWSINGVPDGGYLMGILAKAMQGHCDRTATPILTANYLARSVPGDALVRVEKITQSKQFERFQASLVQDDIEKIRAIGTFSSPMHECSVERYESAPPDLPPPDDCVKIPPLPDYTLFSQMDIRLDPACTGWATTGELTDRSEIKGWIRFRKTRQFDMAGILLAADSFPPAVFTTQGLVAWVPTIELSINIRNLPVSRWLKGSFRTRYITCGLLEEDGELWDADDQLVAISRQIAQYRTVGSGSTAEPV
jgi:hypothetical protein